ncbi:MAG: hypothetical protein AAFV54_00915 [Pseudomonadota bacterium]
MTPENDPQTDPKPGTKMSFNLVAFLVVFGFIWLVFDNMALGLIFGLIFAGGSEVAQRTSKKSED